MILRRETPINNARLTCSLISDSFYEKAELEQFVRPAINRGDYKVTFDPIWHLLVEQGLSFVIKNTNNETLGVCLNFDLRDEPDVELSPGLTCVFELLESLERPIMYVDYIINYCNVARTDPFSLPPQ